MLTVSGSHSREPAGLKVFSVSVEAAFTFLFSDCESFLFVCLFILRLNDVGSVGKSRGKSVRLIHGGVRLAIYARRPEKRPSKDLVGLLTSDRLQWEALCSFLSCLTN